MSRTIATRIIPDTLDAPAILESDDLAYPRTVLIGNNRHIYTSDTKNGGIFVFTPDGELERSFRLAGTTFPYLAGWRQDSLVVFDPETHRFHFVVNSVSTDSVTVANVPSDALQYVLAHKSQLYLKAVKRDTTHMLWTLDRTGQLIHEVLLYGSAWEHAGFLRNHDHQLVSLSGFYPRALVWSDDLSNGPDTLRWWGFDSPMLRRTYAFDRGDGRGPPLITTSASAAGEFWFVLNQRAGWLRVDIYTISGTLQHVLVEANPEYIKNFYPIDLSASLNTDGTYQLAIALVAPEPSIRVYTWTPPNPT